MLFLEERRGAEQRGVSSTSTDRNEMLVFFPEKDTTKCTVGLLLIFLPSLPPFPACLQHMSPPLVAMATAPHVVDRRERRRGRGGEEERGRQNEYKGKNRKAGKGIRKREKE